MFASQLILGFRHLLRDGFACCRFPIQWEVLKRSFRNAQTETWLFGGFYIPADVGATLSILTQLVVWKLAALKVSCAELSAFRAAPFAAFHPRVLWFVPWLKVAPRPSAFTSHALKLSPAHRCGLFDLSWLNLLGDSGSLTDGSLSLSSALLHPLKWHYRNICFFSRIFVPARRQPEMRAEPEWLKERASGRLVYIPNLNAYCFCHAGALIGFKTQSAINTERQPTSLCKTHSLVNCFYLRKKRVFLD